MQGDKKFLDTSRLGSSYPDLFRCSQARVYLNRIYNNQTKRVIQEPKENLVLDIEKSVGDVHIDIKDIIERHSIAKDYILELMVINLVRREQPDPNQSHTIEYPIFPRETIIECWDGDIQKNIEQESSEYQRISESYQAVAFLQKKGLFLVADDLTTALMQFDNNIYESAIEHFRKVLEGLRIFAKDNEITDSENRNDAIRDFINKDIQMLSNFGLHHGTYASQEEARLGRDVTVALATYVGTSKHLGDVKFI